MNAKTIVLSIIAVFGPAAIWMLGACNDQYAADCEDEGGVLECADEASGEPCEPDEFGCVCNCWVCEVDLDCADGQVCDEGSCIAPQCQSDDDCPGASTCGAEGVCLTPNAAYRFIMVEGLSSDVSEPFPGSDIDAVGLIKSSDPNVSVWLDAIDDFEDLSNVRNDAASPSSILGPPDAQCDSQAIDRFYSLGGSGSYVIGNFGAACDPSSGERSGCIENGDSIRVVELGESECGQYEDDEYALSVATSDGSFVEIGTGFGSAIININGLP